MKQSMKSYWKKNGFYIVLATALTAVLCISGVAGYRSGMKDKQAAENAAEFREAENAPEVLNESTEEVAGPVAESEKQTASAETGDETASSSEKISEEANTGAGETFGESTELVWPVKGEILKPFSMDTTIYFETLDQYKVNPALLIQADVNQEVVAAFNGTVTAIGEDSVNGTTITVDMGNGYQAVYGQMKDIKVKEGDSIAKGQAIGNVAEPTKYFTEEGSHLHFGMTKDDAPVNPQDYLS